MTRTRPCETSTTMMMVVVVVVKEEELDEGEEDDGMNGQERSTREVDKRSDCCFVCLGRGCEWAGWGIGQWREERGMVCTFELDELCLLCLLWSCKRFDPALLCIKPNFVCEQLSRSAFCSSRVSVFVCLYLSLCLCACVFGFLFDLIVTRPLFRSAM